MAGWGIAFHALVFDEASFFCRVVPPKLSFGPPHDKMVPMCKIVLYASMQTLPLGFEAVFRTLQEIATGRPVVHGRARTFMYALPVTPAILGGIFRP